jgi:hypothetical protein
VISILFDIGEIRSFSPLVKLQSNDVVLSISRRNTVSSTTAIYEDPANPNVKINATSNDLLNKKNSQLTNKIYYLIIIYSSPISFVDFFGLWKDIPMGCPSTNHLGLLY